jgi:two-component system CheB/CheR fusion protein
MNEQLQAGNEEMQEVNVELRLRTDEINQANAFLASILASLQHVAVVLDRDFNILMWNDRATNLWGLRADEVRGRSIFGLDIGLPVERLRTPIRSVLNGDSTDQEITLNATTQRGSEIQCRITCTPLRGLADGVEGVILLMEEIHENRPPTRFTEG